MKCFECTYFETFYNGRGCCLIQELITVMNETDECADEFTKKYATPKGKTKGVFFFMGKITVLTGTTEYPLQAIGSAAGICWGADISDKTKNEKRAKDCIASDHGRVLEWVDINLLMDGYSARVMREFERHHIGASFLQESTRYVEWSEDTAIVIPPSVERVIKGNEQAYVKWCSGFNEWIDCMKSKGVPKEDIAMFYPLSMATKVVDKRNLRSLVEMSHKRVCVRAYWEYRNLMADIKSELSKVSDEWKWICDNLLGSQCDHLGYCPEKKGCGKYPRKD